MEHIKECFLTIARTGTVYFSVKTWLTSKVVTPTGVEVNVLSPKGGDTRDLPDGAITVAILDELKGSSSEDLSELGIPEMGYLDTKTGQLYFEDPR